MLAHIRQLRALILTAGMILVCTNSALAERVFSAPLNGVTAGTASTATGTATLTLNDLETEANYVISFSGLGGSEFAAHFHNGAPGVAGPVMEPLPIGSPKLGTWFITPAEIIELDAGRVYVNIHTNLYTAGEIRGDLAPVTVANEAVTWGAVKALFN